MKNLRVFFPVLAVALSFSSCCSMFGVNKRQFREERVVAGYDKVEEQVPVEGSKAGLSVTAFKKVPRYKMKKVFVPCGGPRLYCADKECGSTGTKTLQMASTQGSVGSPNLGLIPSMKKIAP